MAGPESSSSARQETRATAPVAIESRDIRQDQTQGLQDPASGLRHEMWGRPANSTPRETDDAKPAKPPGVFSDEAIVPGQTTHTQMTVDGVKRDVWVHAPKNYNHDKPVPMVVVFNGIGYGYNGMPGGAAGMDQFTGLGKEADKKGFLVIYPDGNGIAHGYNNKQLPFDHDDDVKFTRNLIDRFTKDPNVDKDHVFLAGFSEGASFAHIAASELSSKVAGVIDVAGYRAQDAGLPAKPLSELNIHSVQDERIPFNGSASDSSVTGWVMRRLGFQADPTQSTNSLYRSLDHMGPQSAMHNTYELHPKDGSVTKVDEYVNKNSGRAVTAVEVPNLHHGWPGSSDSPESINATGLIGEWIMLQTARTKSQH